MMVYSYYTHIILILYSYYTHNILRSCHGYYFGLFLFSKSSFGELYGDTPSLRRTSRSPISTSLGLGRIMLYHCFMATLWVIMVMMVILVMMVIMVIKTVILQVA